MTLTWKDRQREGNVVSGNACIPWAPIRVMQDRGEVHMWVCVWGRSGGNEVTVSSLRYLQSSMNALTKKRTMALAQKKKASSWFGACWLDKMKKSVPVPFQCQRAAEPGSIITWAGEIIRSLICPFPHPPDHYHNSVLISTATTTQQQPSKTDPKLWLCLLLLPEREMWRFGDGVGAEISQGLWSHSWYKKGSLWCGEGVVL